MAKQSKKSGGSLQEQLRQAGLVTEKQLRRANKQQNRQDIQSRKGQFIDEDKVAALKTRTDKADSDRQLNRQREQAEQAKSLQAQIKQLIEMNRIPRDGDINYKFVEDKKIRQIYVSEIHQTHLNNGQLAIVKMEDSFELVPAAVARKIMARSEESVLYLYEDNGPQDEEDDYYKDYKIPDDLTW